MYNKTRFKASFIYKQGLLYSSPFVFLDKGELVSPYNCTIHLVYVGTALPSLNKSACKFFMYIIYLLPPTLAAEVIETVLSVCVCLFVCLSVSTLTGEPFNVWPRYLVQGLTLMTSWTCFMVKVIGQRSRSSGQKRHFHGSDLSERIPSKPLPIVWHYNIMWHHSMTSWRHNITWCHNSQRAVGGAATLVFFRYMSRIIMR